LHRTEGANNVGNLFADGPPGTTVEENSLNAIQEELAGAIEAAGIVLQTAATDTRNQLAAVFALKANDAGVVHTTGNESIAGIKTFSDNIVMAGDKYVGTSLINSIFFDASSSTVINSANNIWNNLDSGNVATGKTFNISHNSTSVGGSVLFTVNDSGFAGFNTTPVNSRIVTIASGGVEIQNGAHTATYTINSLVIDYSTPDARFYSVGPDATTKGGFQLAGIESDGGGTVIFLDIDGISGASNFIGIKDTSPFVDDGDVSKKMLFSLSGLPGATTINVTAPSADGVMLTDNSTASSLTSVGTLTALTVAKADIGIQIQPFSNGALGAQSAIIVAPGNISNTIDFHLLEGKAITGGIVATYHTFLLSPDYYTTGANTPTLGANCPGAAGAPDQWIKISLNGTTAYIPAWT